MRSEEFFDKVEADPDLTGISVTEHGMTVEHRPSHICTRLTFDAIEKLDWETARKIISCERSPEPLYTVSRVVGYMSRVENWNASKMAERRDRLKGTYSLDVSPAPERKVTVPEAWKPAHGVTIFGGPDCPSCQEVKSMAEELEIPVKFMDVTSIQKEPPANWRSDPDWVRALALLSRYDGKLPVVAFGPGEMDCVNFREAAKCLQALLQKKSDRLKAVTVEQPEAVHQ